MGLGRVEFLPLSFLFLFGEFLFLLRHETDSPLLWDDLQKRMRLVGFNFSLCPQRGDFGASKRRGHALAIFPSGETLRPVLGQRFQSSGLNGEGVRGKQILFVTSLPSFAQERNTWMGHPASMLSCGYQIPNKKRRNQER